MSVIFVFVGQCGNQIGMPLLDMLHRNPTTTGLPGGIYVAVDGYARCILVDTEPKVVSMVQQRMPTFLRKENVVCEQSGRGNNWAHGYYGLPQKKQLQHERRSRAAAFTVPRRPGGGRSSPVLELAMRSLHTELHRAEYGLPETVVVVHSVAGGTGSGLGSRLVEGIRRWHTWDGEEGEDPAVEGALGRRCKALYLVSVAVLPFETVSDVSVQYINMALCLSCVMPLVDGILFLKNSFESPAEKGKHNGGTLQSINERYAALLYSILEGPGWGSILAANSLTMGEGIMLVPTTVAAKKSSGEVVLGGRLVHVPTEGERRDLFREMLKDVALKLVSKAYLFQYTQHDEVTEEALWQALWWMRSLIPP